MGSVPNPPPGPDPGRPDGSAVSSSDGAEPLETITPEEAGHLIETLHSSDMTPGRIRRELDAYRAAHPTPPGDTA